MSDTELATIFVLGGALALAVGYLIGLHHGKSSYRRMLERSGSRLGNQL